MTWLLLGQWLVMAVVGGVMGCIFSLLLDRRRRKRGKCSRCGAKPILIGFSESTNGNPYLRKSIPKR